MGSRPKHPACGKKTGKAARKKQKGFYLLIRIKPCNGDRKSRRNIRNPLHTVNGKRGLRAVCVKGHRFDIRNLIPKRDGVRIFGFDGKNVRAVLTDQQGRLQVVPRFPCPKRVFHEEKFLGIETKDHWLVLPSQNTSTQVTYSYAFINQGEHSALARVEVGPTAVDFAIDREEEINPRQTVVIVPTRFLRFTRVVVRAKEPGKHTRLDIYFQSQSIG